MYVLALGASTLVVVAGLSVVAITRAQGRAADAERDAAVAGLAARSGIEIAAAWTSSTPDWRTRAAHLAPLGPLSIDRARVTLFFADEADATMTGDATQPVRVTAVARSGGATRALSAVLMPPAPTPIPALGHAAFSGGTMTVDTIGPLIAGSLASRASFHAAKPITGDVRAPAVTGPGPINGRVTTGPGAAHALPTSAAWDALRPLATNIPFSSLPGGKLDCILLGPASNPFGTANARGIYQITVPGDKLMEITRCRLSATLLITLSGSAGLKLVDEVLWEPPRPDQPALIVSGSGSQGVVFEPSDKQLVEKDASRNFNPPGSPYDGATDTKNDDKYPNRLQGVFHVMHASTPVTLGKHSSLTGALLVTGTLRIAEHAEIAPDPALLAAPPIGYAAPSGPDMIVLPGSLRWEVEPAGP